MITHVFFDVGGVLGSSGWGAESRARAVVVAVAAALAATGRCRLMAINNESAELNAYRPRTFGLAPTFTAFFGSCRLGVAKPARRIFELALAMSQAEPARSVMIDDSEQNLPPARALGMQAIRYTTTGRLRQDLATLGIDA
ncbi:MAG TPA: HAD-IA family hydrolase [Gemmatimonadales bacterium]|nr:HAD-IA family hydrolase [Gemmatimonadales bacterium]